MNETHEMKETKLKDNAWQHLATKNEGNQTGASRGKQLGCRRYCSVHVTGTLSVFVSGRVTLTCTVAWTGLPWARLRSTVMRTVAIAPGPRAHWHVTAG